MFRGVDITHLEDLYSLKCATAARDACQMFKEIFLTVIRGLCSFYASCLISKSQQLFPSALKSLFSLILLALAMGTNSMLASRPLVAPIESMCVVWTVVEQPK